MGKWFLNVYVVPLAIVIQTSTGILTESILCFKHYKHNVNNVHSMPANPELYLEQYLMSNSMYSDDSQPLYTIPVFNMYARNSNCHTLYVSDNCSLLTERSVE